MTSNILTINGVFSAILITYLFTRISWIKNQKLDSFKQAIDYSQKITEFRRIMTVLTDYFNVWENENSTKYLFDSSKYKNIDFYDFRLVSISDYKPKNHELITKLLDDSNYSEGQSALYLAMISLIRNRNLNYYWQEELYKDYQKNGVYRIETISRWLECNIMDTIAYWLNDNYRMLNFYSLRSHNDEVIQAAGRINAKYLQSEFNNKLIRELAEDMSSHYLPELYSNLKYLKEGIKDLNLLIISLIVLSLSLGVLAPLIYLLTISEKNYYPEAISLISSINATLVCFFIIKFPFMISKELKSI